MKRKNKVNIIYAIVFIGIVSILRLTYPLPSKILGKLEREIEMGLPISNIKLSPNFIDIAVGVETPHPLSIPDQEMDFPITILGSLKFETKHKLYGHKSSVETLAFTSDSKLLLSADRAGEIIVWNLETGKETLRISTNHYVHKAMFDNTNKRIIAINGFQQRVMVYSLKGRLIKELNLKSTINDFEYNPTTNDAYFLCSDGIQVWSLNSWSIIKSLPLKTGDCIKYNNDHSLLAIGTYKGDIILMNSELTDKTILKGHFKNIESLCFSADDIKLGSSSQDQTARIWSIRKGEEVFQLTNEHKGNVSSIEFISLVYTFVTGGKDAKLKYWD